MAKRQLQGEDTTAAQAEIDAIAARQQAVMTELAAKQRAYERDFNIGAKSAFDKYADDATNAAKNVELVLTNSFRSAEDALVQFVQTGKLDFKSLVNSILADLARMELRQNVLGPIAQMMGLKTGSAGGSGGGLLGSVGSLFSGMGGGSSFFGGISDWFKGVQGIGAGTGAAFGNMDFGGFFADGGSTPPNSWVVVGEDGPELMRSGSGGGTVVPNSALGGGAPNVTINMINKGEPMSAQASAPRFDAGSWVIDVVTNRLRTDNNFRQAMQTANRAPI
jgi:lambda family phage tail tape measure protein